MTTAIGRMAVRSRRAVIGRLAIAAVTTFAWAGCDMGLDKPANRYEYLAQQTIKLLNVLRQVTDEASAKAHAAELEELAASIREIQAGITKSEKDTGGMLVATNFSQANRWRQTADNARRQAERIREKDAKAGAIVDKAIEGVIFPESSGL